MKGIETIERWLSDGTLLPPLSETPSFVDFIRLLAVHSGGRQYPETAGMTDLRTVVEPADHLVFVLVDGLGLDLRRDFPAGGFFSETEKRELRAVFPSTTAVALTTLASGAWPAIHGITGWWTYFSEQDRTICPLTFRDRATDRPADRLGFALESLLPVQSMYHSFSRESRSFLPKKLSNGEYAEWSRGGTMVFGYRSFDQLIRQLSRTVRRAKRRTFSYVYTLQVDAACHHHGTNTEAVQEAVRANDHMLGRLRDALPDSAKIVVTSDHGLIDVPDGYTIELHEDEPLLDHLKAPPSGEGSTPVFHVTEGHDAQFLESFERAGLAEKYALITPDEAAGLNLYGTDPLAPQMRSHLGTWIGVAREPYVIEYVPPEGRPIGLKAVHGGLRPQEMRIGLFVV